MLKSGAWMLCQMVTYSVKSMRQFPGRRCTELAVYLGMSADLRPRSHADGVRWGLSVHVD